MNNNTFQTEPACGFRIGDLWITESCGGNKITRHIDAVSENFIIYTRTNDRYPGESHQYSRRRPLPLKDYWEFHETAKCFRAGAQVYPEPAPVFGCDGCAAVNQIVVKVTANGYS